MDVESLMKMVGTNRDGAMLRLTLAKLLTGAGKHDEAEEHLLKAVDFEPDYTAAWKELGKLRLSLDKEQGAREAWQQGIRIAEREGDKQAAKEMTVFLRRLDKPPK